LEFQLVSEAIGRVTEDAFGGELAVGQRTRREAKSNHEIPDKTGTNQLDRFVSATTLRDHRSIK